VRSLPRGSLRKIAAWYGVTSAICALLAAAVPLCGRRWEGLTAVTVGVIYMWVPGLVAVATQRAWGEPIALALGLRLPGPTQRRWVLLALVLPVGVAALVTGLSLLVPGARFDPTLETMLARLSETLPPEQIEAARRQIEALPVHPWFLGLMQAVIAGATINAAAALGEELGWRGLLHRELRSVGAVRTSLLTGLLWGLWHAPLIVQGHNYPDHPLLGVPMMVLFCMSLSLPMFLLRERADSVLAAAIFHGAVNGSAGLPLLVAIGSDLVVGVTGAVGIATWTAVSVALWAWSRPARA
jgi:membrane protease YdiL (CAAX protease family)